MPIRLATYGTAATNDPLNNRTPFALIRDFYPPQLPPFKLELSTAIVDHGQPTAMPVYNNASMEVFYQWHGNEELTPRRTASTQQWQVI
jgi:hypothetical protein